MASTILLTVVLLLPLTIGFQNGQNDLKIEDHTYEDGYSVLAALTGGSVISSNKSDVDSATAITVAEAALANPVTVLTKHVDIPLSRDVTFDIDNTVYMMLVEVIGQIDKKSIVLTDPEGHPIPQRGTTLAVDSAGAFVYKQNSTLTGVWHVQIAGSDVYDVKVKASSLVSFQYSFLKYTPPYPFPSPITGDPPSGENITMKVQVDAIDKTNNITEVTLLNMRGDVIKSFPLVKMTGREGGVFSADVNLPAHSMWIGIVGQDKDGNSLTRVGDTAVHPDSLISIQFEQIEESGDYFNLPFTIHNAGPATNLSLVATTDSMNIKVDVKSAIFQVNQNKTYSGRVRVTSLDTSRSNAGNVLLVVTGESWESQYDSILVTLPPLHSDVTTAETGRGCSLAWTLGVLLTCVMIAHLRIH